MIKCAVFDLDGTLADTSVDLGRATELLMKSYGKSPEWTDDDYRGFVGDGAKKLIDRAFEHTLSDSELDEALEKFKVIYNSILTDNAYIYNGVGTSLDRLKQREIKIAVVTNKPHSSAVIMLNELFGEGYFDFVAGAREDKPKKPDPYFTLKALEALECTSDEGIFFGDSDVDVFTAQNAGMKSVACLWGFRSRKVLEKANPWRIIDNPSDILKVFEKKS